MRVFVAGATGAVGQSLVPQLQAAGHDVTALSRQPDRAEALTRAGVQAVICDVFDAIRLRSVVLEAAPAVVIHQLTDLPAEMDPRKADEVYRRNNRVREEGTRNLAAAAHAAGVRRFIVQSMGTWYRPEGGAIKSEEDPLWLDAPEPIGTAVRTVAEMEALVQGAFEAPVVLRYGAFYGPGTWYTAAGPIATRMRQRLFPMIGAGEGITSFIHVDDAASAAVAAVVGQPGIYNIVDDSPASASEWMPAFAAEVGAPQPMSAPEFMARIVLGKGLATWLATMRGASNGRARRDLGWVPRYPDWRDGFRVTLRRGQK